MASGALLVEDADGVRVITLAHARRKNALTPAMLHRLVDVLDVGAAVRAVVMRGEGDTFSAGFDLSAINDDVRRAGVDPVGDAALAIERCGAPVIAAIDGDCHGGAVELCAACHVVVASPRARFSVPAVRLGLVYPARGLARLVTRLGPAAPRVLATGVAFGAEDAARWGLVQELDGSPVDRAMELARAVAVAAPLAVAGTVQAISAARAGDLEAIERSRAAALASDDLREGVEAAQQRRPPLFRGR